MSQWFGTGRGRFGLGALALTGCLAAWLAVLGADSPAARDVKERLAHQARRVASLEVSYKLETTATPPTGELAKLADFRELLFLPRGEYRDAFKGDKRYHREIRPERVNRLRPTDEYGLTPPLPAGPNDPAQARERARDMKRQYDRVVGAFKDQEARGVPLRRKDPSVLDLPERDVTVASNGRSVWERRPLSPGVDQYKVLPATEPNKFPLSSYLAAVGLQTPDPSSKDSPAARVQAIFRVADWVGAHSYAVEKDDAVDGATCVVLRGTIDGFGPIAGPGGGLEDRIWLDRGRGLAVVRRELSRGGEPVERWENSAFREVEKGLWLPTVVRHHRFAHDAPADRKGKPVMTEEMRVEDLKVNGVADDRFDMAPRQGDVVDDRRGEG